MRARARSDPCSCSAVAFGRVRIRVYIAPTTPAPEHSLTRGYVAGARPGTYLMDVVKDAARARGTYGVFLTVQKKNPNIAFYRKHTFLSPERALHRQTADTASFGGSCDLESQSRVSYHPPLNLS